MLAQPAVSGAGGGAVASAPPESARDHIWPPVRQLLDDGQVLLVHLVPDIHRPPQRMRRAGAAMSCAARDAATVTVRSVATGSQGLPQGTNSSTRFTGWIVSSARSSYTTKSG